MSYQFFLNYIRILTNQNLPRFKYLPTAENYFQSQGLEKLHLMIQGKNGRGNSLYIPDVLPSWSLHNINNAKDCLPR